MTFTRAGISFDYPSHWKFESEGANPREWTVSIHSPDTAFALVSLRPDARDPADLADQTLEVLKAEYPELEAEDRVETVAGQPAIGHDLDFLTVDTAITCRTRCLQTPGGPLLVLCQTGEYDRTRHDSVLRGIVASLTIEGD